jgi:hypothetical protein
MELDQHQDINTKDNFDFELFIVHEQVSHTKERGEAPEYGRNQKQKEKPMPSLPWPVR